MLILLALKTTAVNPETEEFIEEIPVNVMADELYCMASPNAATSLKLTAETGIDTLPGLQINELPIARPIEGTLGLTPNVT
jgi:hypothetical protein